MPDTGFTMRQILEERSEELEKLKGYGVKYDPKKIKEEYDELMRQGLKSEFAVSKLCRKYWKKPSRIYAIMSEAK